MAVRKESHIWEFGDFQTPDVLAVEAVTTLRERLSFSPKTIIEPTCGVGSFLLAAADLFPQAEKIIGVEINKAHIDNLQKKISIKSYKNKISLIHGDFFKVDWEELLNDMPKPILIIGNPPWVTSSDIGVLQGKNLPEKSNFQNHKGFDAVTGKANFDISEWMLIKHLSWIQNHVGCIAMLCKSNVARKTLMHAWKNKISISSSCLIQIDAMRHFKAAVDACFFVVESSKKKMSTDCECYESFVAKVPLQVLGYHEGMMLSDVPKFHTFHDLVGIDKNYTWRSGIKHDCSKIMELKKQDSQLVNGNGDIVKLENDHLFPLLKSSDLSNGLVKDVRLKVIVTQNRVGEETDSIQFTAPKTWDYLVRNSSYLEKRGSTIYKGKPRFSIFGIGPYAFAKWKVAISGFYKKLNFQVVGPIDGKPTMLDDTVYFLNCNSEEEAIFISALLNSNEAKAILESMIFWSDKRPITVDLLKRLHIGKLATRLKQEKQYQKFALHRDAASMLFDKIEKSEGYLKAAE